jgi:TonB family protein
MHRFFACSSFIFCAFLLFAPCSNAQDPSTASKAYVPADVPNSVEGFQAQVDELIRVGKTHDQATWNVALNTLALPNTGAWIEANFAPLAVGQLTDDYPKMRDGHLGHISWVLGHNVDVPGFAIKVEPSEMPAPPSSEGAESSLPIPAHPVAVQNFRLTTVADSGSEPTSWVSSYIFLDGHFRVVGGTYPFWVEELQRIRRPLPVHFGGAIHSARLIHQMAPKYPKEARKQHVEGVVRLHAIIGKDGSPRNIELISGDSLLVDASIKAVRQWRYAPTLLNGTPVEVDTTIDVVFQLNR